MTGIPFIIDLVIDLVGETINFFKTMDHLTDGGNVDELSVGWGARRPNPPIIQIFSAIW
jgi:hypothetical protein